MSRDRRALSGARIPATSASSKGNWGVDAKARHLRRSSSFTFNKRLGGQGFLFVPVNIRLNKASPALYLCSFVLLELGYLGTTDLVSSISGHFATGLELGGIGEIGNFTVQIRVLVPNLLTASF